MAWLEALLRRGHAVVLSVAKLAHCLLCVGFNVSSGQLLFVNSFGEDTPWGGLMVLDTLAVVANVIDAAWLAHPDDGRPESRSNLENSGSNLESSSLGSSSTLAEVITVDSSSEDEGTEIVSVRSDSDDSTCD